MLKGVWAGLAFLGGRLEVLGVRGFGGLGFWV